MERLHASTRSPKFSDLTRSQREKRAKAKAKALIAAVTVPTHVIASCQGDRDECCQHYVGFECDWAQRLFGLVSVVVCDLYTKDGSEDDRVDFEAREMAMALLRTMVDEINLHIGGSPRFPTSYPLINGQDRKWVLSRRKVA